MNIINSINNSLEEQLLLEMAKAGVVGDYEIVVWTNDPGNTPHFHIWDRNSRGNKFHSCIQFTKCSYFFHTGKEGKLNSKERKELVKFLESNHKSLPITNWQYLIALWNDNNSEIELPLNLEIPDYNLL